MNIGNNHNTTNETTRVERIWNKNGKILSLEKPEQPI